MGTILVADDDGDFRDIVVTLLESEGHRVVAATNGADALRILSEARELYCLVLLDLRMPVMSGYEFLSHIHAKAGSKTPIVVLSAADDGASTLALGARRALRKPVALDELLCVVDEYCPRCQDSTHPI